MPRPPILPTVDWKSVFESGKAFENWLSIAENRENAEQMRARARELPLEPRIAGALRSLSRPVHVVAIAEDWCGDVIRHVPVLERMAAETPNLRVRYITRDQHPDVFVRFLTNGGEAIPKLVFLNGQFVECGNWGPMPARHRELISRGKACGDVGAARKKVSALYDSDPECREVVGELDALVLVASAEAP